MTNHSLKKTKFAPGKVSGASPAEDRYYVMVLFDVSNPKKYRLLMKILKKFGTRIQKSVFEAQLKSTQIKELLNSIERLMESGRFYNPDDNVRVYKISGCCSAVVFGTYESPIIEENIFL